MKKSYSALGLIFITILFASCAALPFFKQPGERIGSCKGYLKQDGHPKMRFSFDIYKQSDGDYTAYMSIPGKGIRYGTVKDIGFENGIVRIELSSPRRVIEGELIKEGLTIEGEIKPWVGKFKIEIDE